MIKMICDRDHISTVFGNVAKGEGYQLSSEAKADHHENIGLGHRAEPKPKTAPAPKAKPAKPAKQDGDPLAAIKGQK